MKDAIFIFLQKCNLGVMGCHSYRRYYYEQRLHRRMLVGEAQHARERTGLIMEELLAELGAAQGGWVLARISRSRASLLIISG